MHKWVSITLVVSVAAFVGGATIAVIYYILGQSPEDFSTAAVSAFLGAFFAFLFVRFGEFFAAYSERITSGHSALVKLEHLANLNMGIISDNIYKIDEFDGMYREYAAIEKRVFLWANRLSEIMLLGDLTIGPTNIDLINELFFLNSGYRKLNDSMDAANVAYAESKQALISKGMEPEEFRANTARFRQRLLEIQLFLKHELDRTINVSAAVRVLAKRRTLLGYLLHMLPGRRYPRNFASQRASEEAKLRGEIEEVRRNSRAEIDAIVGTKDGAA